MIKTKKNSLNKAQGCMKIIGAILFITLFSVQFTSAMTFDNVRIPDSKSQTISIKNLFGIGPTIADYKLTYNDENCFINCKAEGEVRLYKDSYLLDRITLKDVKGGSAAIKDIKIYIDKGSGWEEYKNELLGVGSYKWKIEGTKKPFEKVDWIMKSNGVELGEWAWWNGAWAYKKAIHVTETSGNILYNYSVPITINLTTAYNDGKVKSGCEDIRFANISETGELPYWLETCNVTGNLSRIWFKADQIPATATYDFYIYYGNPTAPAKSNHSNAFLLWDDFDSFDTTKWDCTGSTCTISNPSILKLVSGGNYGVFYKLANYSNLSIDIRMNGTYGGNAVARKSDYTGNSIINFYGGFSRETAADQCEIMYIDGGSAFNSLSTSACITPDANTWYKYKFNLNGLNLNFTSYYDNNVMIGTVNASDVTQLANGRVGFLSLTATSYIDYFQVRGYQKPEPSYTLGTEVVSTIGISLDTPTDNSIALGAVNFSGTFYPLASTMQNVTLYIYNPDDSLLSKDYASLVSASAVSYSWTKTSLTNNTYKWNIYACSLAACTFATSNFTLNVAQYLINSQTYSSTAYETSRETFSLNLSYDTNTITNILGNLIYNGTSYASSKSETGSNIVFTKTLDIPLVDGAGEQQNKSFYWNLKSYNNTGFSDINTSLNNQSVNKIHFEVCNSTYPARAFNFTSYYETNLTKINSFVFAGSFHYWIGSGESYRNLSIDNSSTPEMNLCLFPNRTMFADGNIEYGDGGVVFDTRNYYLVNQSFNNTANNISLFLLPASSATSFILQVQDNSLNAISDAYIFIQRYYPATDAYKIIQISKTNADGKTIGFFQTETVDYRFIIVKNGLIIYQSGNTKMIPESVPYTKLFTVGGISSPYNSINPLSFLVSSIDYNESLKTVTYSYVDSSTDFNQGRLWVYVVNATDTRTICNSTSASQAADLTCVVTGYNGTATAIGYITRDSTESVDQMLTFDIVTNGNIFGGTGLLIAFFIILASALAFIWSPQAGIIAVNIAVILVNISTLVNFGWIFIFGMIIISLIISLIIKQ